MGALADSGLLGQGDEGLWGCDDGVIDGASYQFTLDNVCDASGDPLDPTGITVLCYAADKVGGISVLEFATAWSTVTVDAVDQTRLTITADDDDTTGKALGRKNRRCVWSLSLDDGTDTFYVWAAYDSNFTFHGRG